VKKGAVLFILVCLTGCSANLFPTKDAWFALHYIVMPDSEKKIYAELAPEERPKFQQLFWAARTPEAKQEFERRLAFVNTMFKGENASQPWNTDRSRIYLLNGPPDFREEKRGFETNDFRGEVPTEVNRSGEDIVSMSEESWRYRYKDQVVFFIFRHSSSREYKMKDLGQYERDLMQWNKNTLYRILDVGKYQQDLNGLKKSKR